jgi:hypothetical protein
MKKVIIGFFLLLISVQLIIAQPVSDNAVIPMGITLSSVLRLNVVSGGNIEFVFNSIADFQEGLYGDMYRTNLTVESSTDWALQIYASDFTGSAGTFDVGIVDYCVQDNGSGNAIAPAIVAPGAKGTRHMPGNLYANPGDGVFTALSNGAFTILDFTGDGNDGVAADNNFFIRWRCGVGAFPTVLPAGPSLINDWIGTGVGRSSSNVLVSLIPR